MDINKEREAFEAAMISKGIFHKDDIEKYIIFNAEQNKYEPTLACTEDDEFAIQWMSIGWRMWCEAKKQATPEVLNAHARVGGLTFQRGIKWSTVIESAQRLYKYSKDEIKPIISPADMLKIACGDLVLVPKEKIGSLVNELHTAFQSIPILTLGELLPLQQDFQAMIEDQEQINEH